MPITIYQNMETAGVRESENTTGDRGIALPGKFWKYEISFNFVYSSNMKHLGFLLASFQIMFQFLPLQLKENQSVTKPDIFCIFTFL